MDTGLKQRLIGAAVLIALAVIFLPMLVKGPAPDSGVSDVSMKMPDAPGDTETRELPLVMPGDVPQGGAVGMDTRPVDRPAAQALPAQPAIDPATGLPVLATTNPEAPTTVAPESATSPASAVTVPAATALPASTAGGDYAVHFGAYASQKGADTVAALAKAAQLPAYTEAATVSGKPAFRVRIGPYATRAEAEAVRLKALEIRSDVPVRVVTLDAVPYQVSAPAVPASTAATAAAESAKPAESRPVEAKPEPKSAVTKSAEAKPAATKPTDSKPTDTKAADAKPVATSKPATSKPATNTAASKVGFAVQVGAFSDATEAGAMRERLRAAGFTAFTETVNTDSGKLTRVRVGPVLDRAAADQLKGQIQAKTGLDGIVRPHP